MILRWPCVAGHYPPIHGDSASRRGLPSSSAWGSAPFPGEPAGERRGGHRPRRVLPCRPPQPRKQLSALARAEFVPRPSPAGQGQWGGYLPPPSAKPAWCGDPVAPPRGPRPARLAWTPIQTSFSRGAGAWECASSRQGTGGRRCCGARPAGALGQRSSPAAAGRGRSGRAGQGSPPRASAAPPRAGSGSARLGSGVGVQRRRAAGIAWAAPGAEVKAPPGKGRPPSAVPVPIASRGFPGSETGTAAARPRVLERSGPGRRRAPIPCPPGSEAFSEVRYVITALFSPPFFLLLLNPVQDAGKEAATLCLFLKEADTFI